MGVLTLMAIIECFDVIGYDWTILDKLFEETCNKVGDSLDGLFLIAAVNVCNADIALLE